MKSCQFSAFGMDRLVDVPTAKPNRASFTVKATASRLRSTLAFELPDLAARASTSGLVTASLFSIGEDCAPAKSGNQDLARVGARPRKRV